MKFALVTVTVIACSPSNVASDAATDAQADALAPADAQADALAPADAQADALGPVDASAPPHNADAALGALCSFNRECALDQRCECDEVKGCACAKGARGAGVGCVDKCKTGNDCESSVCVEGPGADYSCSKECAGPADCSGSLPLCSNVAFVGKICVRQPPK